MNNRIKVVLPWVVIAIFLLIQLAQYFFGSLEYSLESQLPSPDERHTVFEFRSNNDGAGHAPYGTLLSLSRGPIHVPDEGFVFFAGYCKRPLSYSWQGNRRLIVRCQSSSNEPIRTQAVLAFGIRIELKAE